MVFCSAVASPVSSEANRASLWSSTIFVAPLSVTLKVPILDADGLRALLAHQASAAEAWSILDLTETVAQHGIGHLHLAVGRLVASR